MKLKKRLMSVFAVFAMAFMLLAGTVSVQAEAAGAAPALKA